MIGRFGSAILGINTLRTRVRSEGEYGPRIDISSDLLKLELDTKGQATSVLVGIQYNTIGGVSL